ncbi:MAG: Fis family transcriptional regulator [Deltaproteobacteria bacterium HGW-Deltaproteobacteria-8]|jgi:DNA-binding NtrC family response regulator|nr:MAG: Fis family transcriptional regulator [Deltaproteobacteria bacterium HGW-Deltaproteobacteria-8]
MPRVLIVDDDPMLCEALALAVQQMGFEADTAGTLKDGLGKARAGDFDVVVLDVRMPDGNGLDSLPGFQECPSAPEVIILTGAGDPDGAELAIRSGAWSYIAKPPTLNTIRLPIQRAMEHHRGKQNVLPLGLKRSGIIGESRAIHACMDLVAQAAATEASVLITGETGTGKELFARAIHDNSARADGPFVVVDCAALPEKLVESELFGYERGAFTGADRRFEGMVHQAHRGTLFLDEIGELPMAVQKAFLRVLQDGRYRPVGGLKELQSDFRLLVATNRDLEALAGAGAFRQDLLFRIRTMTIDLPRLKERGGDIARLCRHFVARQCRLNALPAKRVSPDYLDALEAYNWPGNVRELIHAVEHSLAAAMNDPVLVAAHLPTNIRVNLARNALPVRQPPRVEEGLRVGQPLQPLRQVRLQAVAEVESRYLRELLAACGGDIPKACAMSGLSRARLYALLKAYGLS